MKTTRRLTMVLMLLYPLAWASQLTAMDSATLEQQGEKFFQDGDLAKAVEAYREAIKLDPNNAKSLAGLGFAYSSLHRYEEAIEAYQKAIQLQPNAPFAYGGLGTAYHMLGRYTESAAALKNAIRLKPEFAEAHYVLGRTYLMLGNRDGALEEYKVLQSLDPKSANELLKSIPK